MRKCHASSLCASSACVLHCRLVIACGKRIAAWQVIAASKRSIVDARVRCLLHVCSLGRLFPLHKSRHGAVRGAASTRKEVLAEVLSSPRAIEQHSISGFGDLSLSGCVRNSADCRMGVEVHSH